MKKTKKVRKTQYRVKVKNGKMIVHPHDRQAMKAAMQNYFEGKELIITFEIDKKKRNLPRNNHYWGFVIPIACQGFIQAGTDGLKHNEESYHAVHRMFKEKFLDNAYQLVTANAEVINVASTTTTLSNNEFDDYVEDIRRWCAENLNVEIPYRGENLDQPEFTPNTYEWEQL